jgi:hypothetical protein
MIWFACKQCNKVFNRPAEQAGTLVFCACGAANRVPWESTVAAPESPAEPGGAALPREEQPLRMSPLDEDDDWLRRRTQDRRRPRREVVHPDPAYCFNHSEIASQQTCADCGVGFCTACVISLQGQTLCGPCKNFRLRSLQRPSQVSALAIVALALGLVAAPMGLFCFSSMMMAGKVPVLGYMGTLFPLLTLVMGFLALKQIESNPRLGGRALAITAVLISLVAAYLTVAWVEVLRRQLT